MKRRKKMKRKKTRKTVDDFLNNSLGTKF